MTYWGELAETNQENCCTPIGQIKRYVDCKGCDRKPIQETLEEAACKALGYDYNDWVSLFSKDKSTVIYSEVTNWCKGVKWQQERSYSEEEVIVKRKEKKELPPPPPA